MQMIIEHQAPWVVYLDVPGGTRIEQARFETREEAMRWMREKMEDDGTAAEEFLNKGASKDRVTEAAMESFPASDPPGWIKTPAGPCTDSKDCN